MTCRELIESLSDYPDGDLAAEQRGKFDEHLSTCPPCRRYLSQFRRAIERTRSQGDDPQPQLPPGLVKAILKAARNDQA